MKKNIFLIVLLICICFGMVACSKDEVQDTGDTEESFPEENNTQYITIAENGTVNYQIVYPCNSNDKVITSARDLFKAIEKRSNGTPKMHDDYSSANVQHDSEALEILIGKTSYAETQQVLDDIGYGEWKICAVGNKIVVTAYSEESIQTAVTKLIVEIKNGSTEDGAIRLPENFELSGSSFESANYLPKYIGNKIPNVVDSGDDASLAVFSDTSLDEYDRYLAKLEALGYTYYTSNKMAENYFATYHNGEYLIHAGYYGYEKAARITIEPKTDLVSLSSENVYTANPNVTTSLAQFGVSHTGTEYAGVGMAYVIQLADGSFIVIDSGYGADADRLYSYMKSKAPDGNIVIASWIITHSDGDHIGGILMFAPRYKDKVTIEQLIFNFPGADTYLDMNGSPNTTVKTALSAYEECKIIKAHAGQKFFIRNAVVEILSTLESYLPKKTTIFNNTSLAFTVDIEDERLMFLGDISDELAEVLYDTFEGTDYLRCDFLQLSHHGIRNSHGTNMPNMVELYTLMRPSVVLWPTSNTEYLNTNRNESYQIHLHQWNAEAADVAREVWIAGEDYATVFELPYGLFSARRELITIVE